MGYKERISTFRNLKLRQGGKAGREGEGKVCLVESKQFLNDEG